MDRRMRQEMQTPERAEDVASADLVYLTDHSFALWCHRQRTVVKDQLRSASPAKRLKARACLEAAAPADGVARAVDALPKLNANDSRMNAQPLVPERLVPCNPQLKEELWRRLVSHRADTYAPGPPVVRSSCPGRPLLYVRRTRTSLGRAVRTAYRVPWHRRSCGTG